MTGRWRVDHSAGGVLFGLSLTSVRLGVRHFSRFLRSGLPDNSHLPISVVSDRSR
jgi:hypothetical protein